MPIGTDDADSSCPLLQLHSSKQLDQGMAVVRSLRCSGVVARPSIDRKAVITAWDRSLGAAFSDHLVVHWPVFFPL